MILCSDGSYYTGCTNDMARRYRQHQCGRGAKYFLGRKPVRLIYLETAVNRSEACRREAELKKLNRAQKAQLIISQGNEMAGLVC